MADPIRAALERLVETIEGIELEGLPEVDEALAAARTALAEQQGEGPTLEEVEELLNRFAAFNIECLQGLINDALARWGRQPAPHDDRGVLPMVISDTGASDEPERERIICASISGGADYVNNMPRTLTLERINSEGSTYQQYIQEPTPPAEGEVAELAAKLRRLAPHNPLGTADPTITRAAELLQRQQAKIESLEQQLETERMRVVACGIIATSDTPFSAAKNRNCHPDYWSASADDIARQIDELMRLRAQQTPGLVSEREATAIEALKRLRRWGRLSGGGYSADVVLGVVDWIDGGMEGPLPPLPAHALPLPQGEVE